jgi:hypothetical protein
MALITTDAQESLREVMKSFLARYSSEETVRAVMDGPDGYDPKAWQVAADQIGVQAWPFRRRWAVPATASTSSRS